MTPEARLHLFDTVWVPMLRQLLVEKGRDYGSPEEVHANFKAVEALGVCSFQRAKLSRLVEKAQRLALALGTNREHAILQQECPDLALMPFLLWVDRE